MNSSSVVARSGMKIKIPPGRLTQLLSMIIYSWFSHHFLVHDHFTNQRALHECSICYSEQSARALAKTSVVQICPLLLCSHPKKLNRCQQSEANITTCTSNTCQHSLCLILFDHVCFFQQPGFGTLRPEKTTGVTPLLQVFEPFGLLQSFEGSEQVSPGHGPATNGPCWDCVSVFLSRQTLQLSQTTSTYAYGIQWFI